MPNDITIGHARPCFIIAEAGVNHNGDVELAHRLIDAGADAGADAVKFQTFAAERLVSPLAAKAAYQKETTGEGNQLQMLKALELPPSAWAELDEHCEERGVLFMSSPFDEDCVDLLVDVGVDVLKLGSGEITNRPLIEHCALTGLPLIVSTGMSDRKEVVAACAWHHLAFQRGSLKACEGRVRFDGSGRLGLMHCVSSYPAPRDSLNLRAIASLRDLTHLPVGYSDHSVGIDIAPLAVAAGACMIEKHVTLDCGLPGPDHRASVEPREFAAMVCAIREVEAALGDGRKQPHESELNTRDVARKSITAARDIAQGEVLTVNDLAIRRPGTGLAPSQMLRVLGRKALRAIAAGESLRAEWVDLVTEEEKPFF